MKRIERRLLDIRRMGNNATDKEWAVVYNWLSTGRLSSKKDAEICYFNISSNKKWYYSLYKENFVEWHFLLFYFAYTLIPLFLRLAYDPVMNGVIANMIGYSNEYMTLGVAIPVEYRFAIWGLSSVATIGTARKVIWNLGIKKPVDELAEGLGLRLKAEEDKMLNDSANKELNQDNVKDMQVAKKNNDIQASSFVKLIGEDIKLVMANSYPNWEGDIAKLRKLANMYVDYIILEKQQSGTNAIKLELSKSFDFYTELNKLEEQIKKNIEINAMRQSNEKYLDDIMNGAKSTYSGPVKNGSIPTIGESAFEELTETNDKDLSRKLELK